MALVMRLRVTPSVRVPPPIVTRDARVLLPVPGPAVTFRPVPLSAAPIVPLAAALDELVSDGVELALEGADLLPVVPALLRRSPRDLVVVASEAGPAVSALVEAGLVTRLAFGTVSFAPAAEVEVEEHTVPGMAARYAAGAAGLPFATVRYGYAGTDLLEVSRTAPIRCPFTGEQLTALPALRPDVAIVSAARADEAGNVELDGIARSAVLAAARSLVVVGEVVPSLPGAAGSGAAGSGAVGSGAVPGFAVTRVAVVERS
jgi:glutaconate CoA-transferase, subunit A